MPPPSTSTGTPSRSILKTSLQSAHAHAAATEQTSNEHRSPPPSHDQDHHDRNADYTSNALSHSRLADEDDTTLFHHFHKPGTDPRHLTIALHHARQIQAQKDTANLILDRILELIELPTTSSSSSNAKADPASPAAEDVRRFKAAIGPFQPSDYDNLIQERNIEGKCGYVLCPREHRREDPGVKFRLKFGPSKGGSNKREMHIVPREKLEMWCSEECAERAMYIRVQLVEEPVWERRGKGNEILLLEEARERQRQKQGRKQQEGQQRPSGGRPPKMGEVIDRLEQLNVDASADADEHADADADASDAMQGVRHSELALERGDAHPALRAGRVNVQVVEKQHPRREEVRSPEWSAENARGGSIEGYIPSDAHGKRREENPDDENDQDMLDTL